MTLPRLKARSEFVNVNQNGQKAATSGLVLLIVPNSEKIIRVGFTVTRKVGNAVVRNRIKRRFRALAEDVIAPYGKTGYDYVIIGKHSSVKRPYGLLIKDLKYALHSLHVFQEDSSATS